MKEINGLDKHNRRIYKNHSNENIDKEKKEENITLIEPQGRLVDYVQNYIQQYSTKTIRKDAVAMFEAVISASPEYLQQISKEEQIEYFRASIDAIQQELPSVCIAAATIHYDETTPHMHLDCIPFDDNGNLACKNVINRASLLRLHNNIPIYLQDKGFEVKRGQLNSQAKHVELKKYKQSLKKEIKKELLINEELKNENVELAKKIVEREKMKTR